MNSENFEPIPEQPSPMRMMKEPNPSPVARGRSTKRRVGGPQRFFMTVALVFVASLVATVLYRSFTRSSVFAAKSVQTEPVKTDSQLHLQEFSRLQVKEGRTVWQVKATDAKYFAKEGITHVHNSHVTVYREKQPPVHLDSRTAKLLLDGESLTRADLEGSILVTLREGLKLETEQATYDAAEQVVTSSTKVVITGEGFVITGVGMKLWIDSEQIMLLDDVHSNFEQGSNAPGLESTSGSKGEGAAPKAKRREGEKR